MLNVDSLSLKTPCYPTCTSVALKCRRSESSFYIVERSAVDFAISHPINAAASWLSSERLIANADSLCLPLALICYLSRASPEEEEDEEQEHGEREESLRSFASYDCCSWLIAKGSGG